MNPIRALRSRFLYSRIRCKNSNERKVIFTSTILRVWAAQILTDVLKHLPCHTGIMVTYSCTAYNSTTGTGEGLLCRCMSCWREGTANICLKLLLYCCCRRTVKNFWRNVTVSMQHNILTVVPTVLQLTQLAAYSSSPVLRPLFSVLTATFSLKPKTMAPTRGNAQLQLHYDLQFTACQCARPQSQLAWERHWGNGTADTLVKLSYTTDGNRQLLVLH